MNYPSYKILSDIGFQEPAKTESYARQIARNGNIELIAEFIASEFPISHVMACGRTMLHHAVFNSNCDVLRLLVLHGAGLDVTSEPNTAWIYDERRNRFGEAGSLYTDTGQRFTPLHDAVGVGYFEATKTLILLGANIEAIARGTVRPLRIAVSQGNFDIAELLIASGACVSNELSNYQTLCQMATNTPAAAAAILRLLIKNGADANYVPENFQFTVCMMAAQGNLADVVSILVEAGTNVNARFYDANQGENCDKYTPIHYAAKYGAIDAATLLILAGADLHALDNFGSDVIDSVVANDDPDAPIDDMLTFFCAAAEYLGEPAFDSSWDGEWPSIQNLDVLPMQRQISLTGLEKIRWRSAEICVALQELQLPALLTCFILEAYFESTWCKVKLHHYWNIAVAVKHFLD